MSSVQNRQSLAEPDTSTVLGRLLLLCRFLWLGWMSLQCEAADSFDLNDAVDLLLPLYLLLAIAVIVFFKPKDVPSAPINYKKVVASVPSAAATRAPKRTDDAGRDWKVQLVGHWNICWADDLERWLKFLKRPFVWSMAQSMFFQINQRVSFVKEKEAECGRDARHGEGERGQAL
jgi:hypothetical protein